MTKLCKCTNPIQGWVYGGVFGRLALIKHSMSEIGAALRRDAELAAGQRVDLRVDPPHAPRVVLQPGLYSSRPPLRFGNDRLDTR